MINWLKWKIAGKEMIELERWRAGQASLYRWLSESNDVSEALYGLRVFAVGGAINEERIRDNIRRRAKEHS
jgi:hypothetical protein